MAQCPNTILWYGTMSEYVRIECPLLYLIYIGVLLYMFFN